MNNLLREHAEGTVVRAMKGHTTEAMTDHYSRVELPEKRAAMDAVFAGLRMSARRRRKSERCRGTS